MSLTLLLCVHPQQSQHRRRSLAPINTAPPTQAPQSPAAALAVPLGTLAFALRDILDMRCATSLEMVIRDQGECLIERRREGDWGEHRYKHQQVV
jgi:hypothetical protein